jgi:hypothetical protein
MVASSWPRRSATAWDRSRRSRPRGLLGGTLAACPATSCSGLIDGKASSSDQLFDHVELVAIASQRASAPA